ncbi:MAG: NAD(+)/NADH kinase [Lachnospiraceae bacterium]|nr:NAD(+)/NADH kinase [Lachnospiraceae bacterium]MDE6698008.1 NAD(+)/NADH kinase [Lachnospiraceae bacterium]
MNKFLIIANSDKNETIELASKISDRLLSKNAGCKIINGYVEKQMVEEGTECIIVLGGDGTLLMAARNLVDLNIPFIGINCGNLGFLSEATPEMIDETLEKLLENHYTLEKRMMLTGRIIRNGKILSENVALNDIVINRGGLLRVIDFDIYVNGMKLNQYKADGMIVSTPTGSTAYSMSAGGPIVKPSANLILLTPICPHTLNTRSIILDADDIVELEVLNKRRVENDERFAYFDGDMAIKLISGDRISISKSKISTGIIKLSSRSFIEILKRKMSDNEDR